LVPWKGFKVLIETMPEILKEIPEAKLVIVGGGPQIGELGSTIEKLNLKDNVVLTGPLKREEVLEHMQKSNMFVLNTGYEGFAHLLLEAANFMIPVVTTNIGGNPELIENNKEGILVEPNDKEAIKNAVVKIFQDDTFRQEIVQNAYQKSKQFSIQNTLDNLEKLLVDK
jgi:glycosyltransferase involved in cell wall biosynthesis